MSRPVVTEQLLYNKISNSISAVASEQIFIPVNGTSFSYHGTNEIRIRLATPVENAFLDDRHSYVRMSVENPNPMAIYFDTLSSSIIKSVRLESGGVALENTNNYGALMNLLLEHFSSNEFNNEMAILSGFTNVALKGDKLDLENDATKNYGTNVIQPRSSRQITIPLISSLLKTKLIPLCFLGNSFLEIILELQDPRIAFLCDGRINEAGAYAITDTVARDIKYTVSGVEYVSNIISIRNNEMVGALGKQLLSDGLYFCGKTYTCYNNIIPVGAPDSISFNIPDKSQSLAYAISACYLGQADPRFSNLQSGLYGTTSIQYQVGSEYMPRTRPISYTSENVIQPYLHLQKVSSNGFFSTNNSTSITLNSFSRQSPNTILDFGSTGAELSTGNVGRASNFVRPSSFCNAYSFQSFDNMMGNAEVGLNTVTLSLPLTINLTRKKSTYFDLEGKYIDNTDVKINTSATKDIPQVNFFTWCVSDVIWRLSPSGVFEMMK